MPHAHILVWLKQKGKFETPSDINKIISAEIPSKEEDPSGFQVVIEFMLHGPCGKQNPNSPCMMDGKCTKHYPKSYQAQTTINEDGFPNYRSRNYGIAVTKGTKKLDNRFVVPYNRYLLLKYRAHINVEWCNRSGAIKYFFKYMNKGPDRANAIIQENLFQSDTSAGEKFIKVDEIKHYLDCRFLSPCDAFRRIFSFDIHYSKPSVMRLTFHLPDQNLVIVHDSQTLPVVLRKEGIEDTMLTEWLKLNKSDDAARQWSYAEISKKYVWKEEKKMWTSRKKGKSIGRITHCHPTSGEIYYLRMLLNVVKGPISFQEIRTTNDKVYNTFREACCILGIVNDEKEWTTTITEARQWASGKQIRELFVTILLFCEVNNPRQFWEKNWQALSEDILYQKREQFRFPDLVLIETQIQNYCLLQIEEILDRNGKSIADYPDIPMTDATLLSTTGNRLI